MQTKLVIAILNNTNLLLVGWAILSTVFFYFALRSRFKKKANVSRYAVFFYALVFYLIAALSYIGLNAISRFFFLSGSYFMSTWFFFPYVFIAAIFGGLCGKLIYWAALKIAPEYVFTLLNVSLFIISPMLILVLLIEPYQEQIKLSGLLRNPIQEEIKKPKSNDFSINEIGVITSEEEDTTIVFIPAIPAIAYDSLTLNLMGNMLSVANRTSGEVLSFRTAHASYHEMYISAFSNGNYLAILIVYAPLTNETELLVIDKTGKRVFSELYSDYPNRLSVAVEHKLIRLESEIPGEEIHFKRLLQFP